MTDTEKLLNVDLPKATNLEAAIIILLEATKYISAVLCLKYEGNVLVEGSLEEAFHASEEAFKQGIHVYYIEETELGYLLVADPYRR